MCSAQGWKATGDKPKLVGRIAKKEKELLKPQEGLQALIESKIGPRTASGGAPSKLRRFYTDNYGCLDRFDRLWYEMTFNSHARDWESYFCWCLIHASVVNARSLWCALRGEPIPLKVFLQKLVDSFATSNQS
jgi:hypothetical protein